ncbi:MAG: hypothetical protein HKL98_03650 [Burkholderiales bacterium]|nr:hypothetical protein [Burkholderiales bacterium]
MQFIPVNRPISMEKKDETEINSIFNTRAVRKTGASSVQTVSAETHPPKALPPAQKQLPKPPEQLEPKEYVLRTGEDRRKVCRRIQNQSMPYDLRGKGDRRKKKQRTNDITTSIDEIA